MPSRTRSAVSWWRAPDVLDALGAQHGERLPKLEHQRDRRRPGRLAGLHRALRPPQIEVHARRGAAVLRLPGALAHAHEGEPGRDHPALLRAGHDHVEAPRVRLDRDRGERRDRVHDQQPVVPADDLRDLLERVGHAGRGLVVRDQHRADLAVGGEGVVDAVRVGGRAVLEGEVDRIAAVDADQLQEALAEDADRDDQHAITRRDVVDDGGLHAGGAGAGQHEHVVLGAVGVLQTLAEGRHQFGELRPAMVDHRGHARLCDFRGNGNRTRRTQVHGASGSGDSGRRNGPDYRPPAPR